MTVSFNIPVLGEVRLNWGEGEAHPATAPAASTATVEAAAQALPAEGHETPSAVVTPSSAPVSIAALPSQELAKPTEETKKTQPEGAPSAPQPLVVAEKKGDDKSGAKEGDDKKQKEESLAKTSVVDFVNATPSVKSQIQQTEVVKASLDAKSVQPEGDAPRPSAASSAPATAVLREVPAVQAVLRAKIEDQLTAFPELAAILEDLVSALSASIEETTAAAIRSRCAALLNALLPSLSGELQSAFVTQLEAIPQAIEKELETGDWEECCQNAGAILLTLLEQITDGATREVASRLGTGSHAPQKASAVDVEKGELTGLYGSRELCRKQRLQSWK